MDLQSSEITIVSFKCGLRIVIVDVSLCICVKLFLCVCLLASHFFELLVS